MAGVTDAELTGAGVMVLGVRMRPLEDRDVVELDEWVRQRIMDVAVRSIGGLPERTAALVVDVALKRAAGATWLSGDGARMIATLDGVAMMLWCSMDERDREGKTPADLRRLFLTPGAVKEVTTAFRRINRILSGEEAAEKKSPRSADGTEPQSTQSSPQATSGAIETSLR